MGHDEHHPDQPETSTAHRLPLTHWTGGPARTVPGKARCGPGTGRYARIRVEGRIGGGPPGSLVDLLGRWADDMQVRNFTAVGITSYTKALGMFVAWCAQRAITQAGAVTRGVVETYQRQVSRALTPEGQPLRVTTQAHYLNAVVVFFDWCVRKHHLPASPAAGLQLPRQPKSLPPVLTPDEIARIFAEPNTATPVGLRDRTILEVFYGTGLRRAEVAALTIDDVDLDALTLRVIAGKGRKDRISPLTPRTASWLGRYLIEGRPLLVDPAISGRMLFLSQRSGRPMTPGQVSCNVGRLLHAYLDISKRGACHLFRHAMATHLLDNGCDVRAIQELLGHATITSTQLYTRVSVEHLRRAQTAFHPFAAPPSAAPPPTAAVPDDPVIIEDIDDEAAGAAAPAPEDPAP